MYTYIYTHTKIHIHKYVYIWFAIWWRVYVKAGACGAQENIKRPAVAEEGHEGPQDGGEYLGLNENAAIVR